MNNASRLLLAALAVLGTGLGTAQTPPQEPTKPAIAAPQATDIVETAAKSDDLKTFASLVDKAGLTETLKGKGPFTVLAPTDAAFKKLPPGALDRLSADPTLLKTILSYHVLPVNVASIDLKDGTDAKTLQGETIKVGVSEAAPTDATAKPERTVTFNDKTAKVVKADLKATNGTIHTIDSVLVPPSILKAAPPQTP